MRHVASEANHTGSDLVPQGRPQILFLFAGADEQQPRARLTLRQRAESLCEYVDALDVGEAADVAKHAFAVRPSTGPAHVCHAWSEALMVETDRKFERAFAEKGAYSLEVRHRLHRPRECAADRAPARP